MKVKLLASLLTVATLATSVFADAELIKTRIGDLVLHTLLRQGIPQMKQLKSF